MAQQMTFWEEPVLIWHHHTEVHYEGGYREIVCSAQPPVIRPEFQIYAGYVGASTPDACPLCNPVKVTEGYVSYEHF